MPAKPPPPSALFARTSRTDNVRLAIASMVLTVLALSLGDAVIKFIASDFSLWQIYVLRSLLAIPPLVVLLKWPAPGGRLAPVSAGWALLRSFLMAAVWVFYYPSLLHVELSVAASVLYTIPLFITFFSALFTGDRVGVKAWLAVICGFTGVLVIVRPAAEDFNLYALLPLVSAILFACAMILTRTKCRDENPKVLALLQNMALVVTGAVISIILMLWRPHELAAINPFLFGPWAPLGVTQWLIMAALAATVIIGNVCGAFAYQQGPSATIAAFDYCYVVFSVVWGLWLFMEIPDLQSVAGMLMIVASGILIVRRPRAPG